MSPTTTSVASSITSTGAVTAAPPRHPAAPADPARSRRLHRHRRRLDLPRRKIVAKRFDPAHEFAKDFPQRLQRKILRAETRLEQFVEIIERALEIALQTFHEPTFRRIDRECLQPTLHNGTETKHQQFAPERRFERRAGAEREPLFARQPRRKKLHTEQRHALQQTALFQGLRLATGRHDHVTALKHAAIFLQPRTDRIAPGGHGVPVEKKFSAGCGHEKVEKKARSAARLNSFVRLRARQKKAPAA